MSTSSRACWRPSAFKCSPESRHSVIFQHFAQACLVSDRQQRARSRGLFVGADASISATSQPLAGVDRLALVADLEVEARPVLTPAVTDQSDGFPLLHFLASLA